ncbi:MAG: sigma-70 family RNA polymerase sigma factor [Clostridia bacterium]|nr:sigma-70 family RNA polymerase sigma factor [Clostridia bacterium]
MGNYFQLNDEQLTVLAVEKDSEALTVLTERYMNVAKYIASSFSSDNEKISDLVQEGMLGFLGAVYSYEKDGKASFNTYASHCIRNRIISVIRATNTARHIPEDMIVSLDSQRNREGGELTPEESLLSDERAEYITSVIKGELTEKEREIFMLYLGGASYCDIAERTATTVKSVDSALQRARKKLKKRLQNEV